MSEQPPDWATQIPNYPVHNLPARAGGQPTLPLTWQQLQQIVAALVNEFLRQVAVALGAIEIFGFNPVEALIQIGELIEDARANFNGLLSGLSLPDIPAVVSYLQNLVSTITFQGLLDAIANALGHAGSGHTTGDILGYLGAIPGTVIAGATAIEQALINGVLGATKNVFPWIFPVNFGAAPTVEDLAAYTKSLVTQSQLQQLMDLLFNKLTGPEVAYVQGVTHDALAGALAGLQGVASSASDVAQQALAATAGAVQGFEAAVQGAIQGAEIQASQIVGAAGDLASHLIPDIQLGMSSALQTLHNDIVNNLLGFQFPGVNWAPTNTANALGGTAVTLGSNSGNINSLQQAIYSAYGAGGSGGLNATVNISGGVLPSSFTDMGPCGLINFDCAKYNAATAPTDVQSVTTISSNGAATFNIIRGNSDFSSFIFLFTFQSGTNITYAFGRAVSGVISDLYSNTTTGTKANNSITLSSDSGFNFTFLLNGVAIYTYTEAGLSGIGANYRNLGFAAGNPAPGPVTQWNGSSPSGGPATAYVATDETTTSTSYVDLTTTTDTVTVTIGSSGMALVNLHCQIYNDAQKAGFAAFAMSGANTMSAQDKYCLHMQMSGAGWTTQTAGTSFLLTGLTAGSTTFKMKYRAGSSGGTAHFGLRHIAVVPL